MTYLPERGDLAWINFDPQAGREQAKNRPAQVLTASEFNAATGLLVVCPVASTARPWRTRVPLVGTTTKGAIMIEQIKSGQIMTEPAGVTPGGSQIIDLSSPSLTRTLCAPLQMPVRPGTIVPDGRFAIDTEGAAPSYSRHAYLERCGSSLHEPIGTDLSLFTADSQAVLWSAGSSVNELDGVFLPSLRRLKIRLPQELASFCKQKGAVCIAGLALTSHALYVSEENGQVWAAPSPLRSVRAN